MVQYVRTIFVLLVIGRHGTFYSTSILVLVQYVQKSQKIWNDLSTFIRYDILKITKDMDLLKRYGPSSLDTYVCTVISYDLSRKMRNQKIQPFQKILYNTIFLKRYGIPEYVSSQTTVRYCSVRPVLIDSQKIRYNLLTVKRY